MGPEELQRRVDALRWYHRIELPGGVVTSGVYDPRPFVGLVGLPDRLDGLTVLDVGAWDGFWSFEAARRGAARVVATDSYSWSGPGWGSKECFLLARDALQASVEDRDVDVMDLSPESVGTFDIVLFLGVLYHLKDPLGAIERLASVTTRTLIVETECALSWLPFPAAAVFPGGELNADDTNWWAFNERALLGLLESCGFGGARVVWRPSMARRAASAVLQLIRPVPFRSGRVAVHAWR